MPSVTLKKIDGSEAGSVELASDIFEAPQNAVLVREAVNAFLANQRQGTHSTKTRHFVRGGGKKPWKQKGTGRARAGTVRSPLWRGGAIVFGPQPRDYREKINRRKRQAALRAVLSSRVEEGKLIIVDAIDFGGEPKTRKVAEFLAKLGVEGRSLIVTDGVNADLLRAARNIPYVDVTTTGELNVYDAIVNDTLIFTKAAVESLQEAGK